MILFCTVLSLSAAAQGQIKTKQFIISDFREKTMKVVLTGNEILDAVFRQQMEVVWHMGAFEFCTVDEFEKTKANPNYYFMAVTDSKRHSETAPGIKVIGIFKGTAGAASLDELYKVVTIPFCSAENPDGRETAFLPALLSILQNGLEETMKRKINISDSVQPGLRNAAARWDKRCAIADIDFAEAPGESLCAIYKAENIDVVDEETACRLIGSRDEDVMVGYVVAPSQPQDNSFCYTMIIDAQTWELFFFNKRRITDKDPAGFTRRNCQAIIAHKK